MSCYCHRSGISDLPGTNEIQLIDPEDDVWVIFGSRSFETVGSSLTDRAKMVIGKFNERELDTPDVIVSGGADGADAVAEAVALTLDVPMVVFAVGSVNENTSFRQSLADKPWVVEVVTSYDGESDDPVSGNGAYLTRNCAMAEVVGRHDGQGFAIWNGQSNGTQHMMDSCLSHGVETEVWKFK